MRLGIQPRLFVTLLLTSIAVAGAFALALHWNIERGFREYVREREARRMAAVAERLAHAHERHGDWSFLGRDDNPVERFAAQERPPRRDGGPGPVPITPSRLSLVGADGRPIAGTPPATAEVQRQPVTVAGTTIAWLIGEPATFAAPDQRFLRDRQRATAFMGVVALLAAAIASFLLARGLVAPIRRLTDATHRLAQGDFAQRVDWASSDEVGRLVGDFNTLAAKLREADASRRAFLADVSHELRTPLAVLRGELEALEDGIRTLTPEAVRSLQAEVATLAALVDDLGDLAVADLGGHSYHRERFDLADLVQTALHAFAGRLDAARLALEQDVAAPVPVFADPQRLLQVLNNLLENTARYTDPGGRVRVRLRREGASAVLDLEDSAPGVPDDVLPRLFDRLFRVETSRCRAQGGSGLGLALCRGIVAAHGGTIDASPSTLGGVHIAVRLPALESPG